MKNQKVNRKVSSADKNKSGRFTVTFNVTVTSEVFKALNVSSDMTVSELKNIAELTAGVPTSIQRIHYIDEGDLVDSETLRKYGVVPGAQFNIHLWSEWNSLVEAVVSGDINQLFKFGVTSKSDYNTPNSERFSAENRRQWLCNRAFIALFLAAHRGQEEICKRLVESGVDVNAKTTSGRCPLQIAAIMGQEQIISYLVEGGADIKATDADGLNATQLAKKFGRKSCERQLIQIAFDMRAKKSRVTEHPLFAHQRFDSLLKSHFNGEHAQLYFQQLLPPSEFEGTSLNAPKRKLKLPGGKEALRENLTNAYVEEDTGHMRIVEKSIPEGGVDPMNQSAQGATNRTDVTSKDGKISSFRDWLSMTEGRQSRHKVRDGRYNGGPLNWNSDDSDEEDMVAASDVTGVTGAADMTGVRLQRRPVQSDLMDVVIKKKLEDEQNNGIRGLPYYLWLTIGDRTELYKAVKGRGQLDAMMRY